MKEMKKLFFLFALSLCSLGAWAYSFSYTYSGKTLYYNIISGTNVEVTYPGTKNSKPYDNYTKPSGSVVIPASFTRSGTTYHVICIGEYAFRECDGITSVTIPNSVTSTEQYAFHTCTGLTSVTFPNSVTSIGNYTFYKCSGLTSVTIPNSVTNIGTFAFQNCSSLTSVTIPSSVTSLSNYIFYGCSSLTSVTIPNTVTSIGDYALAYCSSLTSVTIPNTVTSLGTCVFRGCIGLTSVTIPNSVTTSGISLFLDCTGLTSVTLPNTMTTLKSNTFSGCSSLTSVTIPNTVTKIENTVFDGCTGLTSMIIPSLVTSVGSNAFANCTNLKTVYNLSSVNITATSYGLSANRVVKCTEYSGAGKNIIYKIPTTYTVSNSASTSSNVIPYTDILTNFIYKDGSDWKAKNIVLTDGQDAFSAPETFTAATATYVREFTNSNRSTLYLPFTASMPQDLEVYEFSGFNGSSLSFSEHTGDIAAYTPYLVGYDLSKDGNTTTCTITQANAVFPKSETANYNPVTHNDMTFQGVISRTQMSSTNHYGYSNGFFVQSGGSAHVNPFRCYFLYTPSSNAPQNLPPTLNVEFGYGDPVGIEAVEMPEQEYDGRYGKDVYDMMGRLVRKNADNLQGLPRGIYIWKGKKVMNYEL